MREGLQGPPRYARKSRVGRLAGARCWPFTGKKGLPLPRALSALLSVYREYSSSGLSLMC